jgi:hypothetical protein
MKLTSALHKLLFLPVCRAYARHVLGDRPADGVMSFLSSIDFWRVHGYWPGLRNPQSFEEKVCYRMLFDRSFRWTEISDKRYVRGFVAEKVGNEYLVPLLWEGEKPDEVPFDKLPSRFVIKTTHGCGYIMLVPDKALLDRAKTVMTLQKWLGQNFCTDKYLGLEWAYKHIQPRILVEMFLDDNGKVPRDYKFFCFSGRVEYLQINFDRFGDPYEKTLDRDFNPLNLWQGTKQYLWEIERPKQYEEMIYVAEKLAGEFDFIRVDMYNVGGRIFVGELTCYPGGGMIRWFPREYDDQLGSKWKLSLQDGEP